MIYCLVPEKNSFGGRDYAGSKALIEAFQSVNNSIKILPSDIKKIKSIIKDNINTKKSKVISTPNAGYLLRLNLNPNPLKKFLATKSTKIQEKGINIFKKNKIETILIWDDPLGQFTNEIYENEIKIETSKNGILKSLKTYFSNWNCTHYSWDTGHIDWVKSLKIIDEKRIRYNPLLYPQSYKKEKDNRLCNRDVIFVGNLYINESKNSKFFNDYKTIEACDFITQQLTPFDCKNRIDILKKAYRIFYAPNSQLPEDDIYFWKIYREINWKFVNSLRRMQILGGVNNEISYFGNFADPNSKNYLNTNIKFKGTMDYFTDLPNIFEESKITLDVVNSLSINGINGKFYECFAANGFMLIDHKKDLSSIIGNEYASLISYKSLEDCQTKINYFLQRDKEREELRINIKKIITANYSPQSWAETVLGENKK